MVKVEELEQDWRTHLDDDLPEQNATTKESIIHWMLGKDVEQFETLNPTQVEIAKQAMAYRYRSLQQRYLGFGPEQAYRHLITRLGSSVLLRGKIRTWVAASREHQRTSVGVLQEVLQKLLSSDRYLQEQMVWIAQCIPDARLRNALLFASLEEYCLQSIRNQPLIAYQLVDYLRRQGEVNTSA